MEILKFNIFISSFVLFLFYLSNFDISVLVGTSFIAALVMFANYLDEKDKHDGQAR
jgi:hypothetical protein